MTDGKAFSLSLKKPNEPRKFGLFLNRPTKTDNSRSLWEGWVDQSRQIPNSMDGSTAPRAIPTKESTSWVDAEEQREVMLPWTEAEGLVPWDTTLQWTIALQQYNAKGSFSWIAERREFKHLSESEYKFIRDDMGKMAHARRTAIRQGWQLTPDQLKYLAERGK